MKSFAALMIMMAILASTVTQVRADWLDDGNPICTVSQNQWYPAIVADLEQRALIVWIDERHGTMDLYAQKIDPFGDVLWTVDGVRCSVGGQAELLHVLCEDRSGGAIVTWYDSRGVDQDIYVQRISSTGGVLWNSAGVNICPAAGDQQHPRLIPTNDGGAIVVWQDFRSPGGGIYAQRLDENGIELWTPNGAPVCTTSATQDMSSIAADGSGGAFVLWSDDRSGNRDLYAQRIDASGSILWATDGVPICTAAGDQDNPSDCGVTVEDGEGGAIVVWLDDRSAAGARDVYAQRINESGAVQWATDGVAVCTATGEQGVARMVADESGGYIFAWHDGRSTISEYDIYAQKINSTGTIQWAADGVAICTAIEPQLVVNVIARESCGGGAIITWRDARDYNDVYAQALNSNGETIWQDQGIVVCRAVGTQVPRGISSDGEGGAFVAWMDYRSASNYDVYAKRLIQPPCDVQSEVLNFGSTTPCDSVDLDFTVYNTGCDTLKGSITESCPHYEIAAGGGSYSLAPGDSQVVTVRFKPTLPGTLYCTIETGSDCANVSCEGISITPQICNVQPEVLNFGTITGCNSVDLDFTIYNTGCDTLKGSITESCPHYEIAAGGGSYSLARHDSQVVTVRFKPAAPGTWYCTIETGSDCANVSCEGISITPPICSVQPEVLNFGTPAWCDSSDLDFTVYNSGCETLNGSITEFCPHYKIAAGGGSYSLAPGDSQVVTVRFKPAAPGTWYCTIYTGTDCANVSCEGTSISPQICRVQPMILSFATPMGDSADQDFTIYNSGCDTLKGSITESCAHYEIAAGGGGYSLAPGDSQMVTVRFKPTLLGTWHCTIQTGVECSNVSCNGISYEPPAACFIEPDTLDFGNIDVGDFKMMTFDITNTGYGTLEGTMSDECPHFAIVSGGTYSLTHSQSQTVTILYFPLAAGPHTCAVVTGNVACTDVYCMGYGAAAPECAVEPDTLDFGIITVTDSLDMNFDMINVGGGILSGTVSDTCSYYDVVAGGGSYGLAAGETLHVTVRFKPPADGTFECRVETGAGCGNVYCSGEGDDASGMGIVDAKRFYLYQNYPNPFNPSTNITFSVPSISHTTLSIYNIEGRLVKTLVNTDFDGGVKTVIWNGTDSRGNPVSTGVYFCRLQAGGDVMTRKMVLLK